MLLSTDWHFFGKGEKHRAIGAFRNTHEHTLLTLFRSLKDDVKRAIVAGLIGASPALVDLSENDFEEVMTRHLEAVWLGEDVTSLASHYKTCTAADTNKSGDFRALPKGATSTADQPI
ncbi:hypothetical protein [Delftia sp. JD2]|uniref:hypothetical protein n=1 Tax=Delftia sp. JD2 TaxID=469553 RepID=UPI00111209F6|nr:hypothetical protein [Delftia sp. JD2]